MTITVEKFAYNQNITHDPDGFEVTIVYQVDGAEDPVAAEAASGVPVYGEAYTTGSPMRVVRKTARIIDESVLRWNVEVTYEYKPGGGGGGGGGSVRPSSPVDGDEYWTLRGAGQTVHVQTAIEQTGFGADAIDAALLVGIDEERAVQGVDIMEGVAELAVTLWKDTADVTSTYLGNLLQALQKTNSTTWYGFSAGEVLYDSFTLPYRGEDITEIEFRFLCRPNLAEGDMPDFLNADGSSITVTGGKKGWQYLWTMPGQYVDAGVTKNYTRGVYVATLYDTDDFTGLGLSGTL